MHDFLQHRTCNEAIISLANTMIHTEMCMTSFSIQYRIHEEASTIFLIKKNHHTAEEVKNDFLWQRHRQDVNPLTGGREKW